MKGLDNIIYSHIPRSKPAPNATNETSCSLTFPQSAGSSNTGDNLTNMMKATMKARNRLGQVLAMNEHGTITLGTLNEALSFATDILVQQQTQLEKCRNAISEVEKDIRKTWTIVEKVRQIQRNLSRTAPPEYASGSASLVQDDEQPGISNAPPRPPHKRRRTLEQSMMDESFIDYCFITRKSYQSCLLLIVSSLQSIMPIHILSTRLKILILSVPDGQP